MKHSSPFGCLLDEDNDEEPTVESALVSTTNDEFRCMNGDAFYISTDLDQQQQLLDLSPSCYTSLGPSLDTSLGTSLSTLLDTSLGICTYLHHCVSSNARKLVLSCGSILKYANLGHELS